MSADTELLVRFAPELAGTDTPAHRWLRDHGLPNASDEPWRFSPMGRMLAGPWEAGPAQLLDREAVDALVGAHAGRLVFVDGVFAGHLSDADGLLPSISYRTETASASTQRPARYDGFQALNEAAGNGGVGIRVAVDANASCMAELALHVVHLTTSAINQPRTVVDLENDAQLTLIESYAGIAGRSITNASTTLTLGARARLTHRRLVTGPVSATHVGHTAITQHDSAELRSWSLLAGIGPTRNAIDVVLDGDGAVAELEGLDLPVGDQEHDTAITVEHAASQGTSRQHFRAVVDGRARTSFGGHVIVAAGTVGNDAIQSARSLLLQPTAQADVRPWLEIFADDVRCSHGATVGRLDEEALFFLRSRGIPRDEARHMLVGAFAAELLDSLHLPTLRSFVDATIAGTLAGERGS